MKGRVFPDLDSDDAILKRLKEIEAENLSLRQKLWKMQYRGKLIIGVILLSIGGVALVWSYVISSAIMTFIGLGLVLWGILIFSISSSKQVPQGVLHAISTSMIKSLDAFLSRMGGDNRIIFFYPKHLKGFSQGYIFVTYEGVFRLPNPEQLAEEKIFYEDPKGILLVAPSQGLVDLFEKDLNVNFATADLAYIQQTMRGFLIDNMKIADEFFIESNDNGSYSVQITGEVSARMCEYVEKETRLKSELGCPICSSIALIMSKVTGKAVTIKESRVNHNTIKTIIVGLET